MSLIPDAPKKLRRPYAPINNTSYDSIRSKLFSEFETIEYDMIVYEPKHDPYEDTIVYQYKSLLKPIYRKRSEIFTSSVSECSSRLAEMTILKK